MTDLGSPQPSPPPREPIAGEAGIATPSWWRFFQNMGVLMRQTVDSITLAEGQFGGRIATVEDQVAYLAGSIPRLVADQAAELAALGNSVTVARQQVEDLVSQIASLTSARQAIIDDMRAQLDGVLGAVPPATLGTMAAQSYDRVAITGGSGVFQTVEASTLGSLAFLALLRTNGTVLVPTAILSGQAIGATVSEGYDGTANSSSSGSAVFSATENWSNTAHGTQIFFATTPNTTTTLLNRFFITQNGDVQFAKTAAPPTPAAGFFALFMDTADNTLKALGPSGTLTPLAAP